jgi:hypothetical protein
VGYYYPLDLLYSSCVFLVGMNIKYFSNRFHTSPTAISTTTLCTRWRFVPMPSEQMASLLQGNTSVMRRIIRVERGNILETCNVRLNIKECWQRVRNWWRSRDRWQWDEISSSLLWLLHLWAKIQNSRI